MQFLRRLMGHSASPPADEPFNTVFIRSPEMDASITLKAGKSAKVALEFWEKALDKIEKKDRVGYTVTFIINNTKAPSSLDSDQMSIAVGAAAEWLAHAVGAVDGARINPSSGGYDLRLEVVVRDGGRRSLEYSFARPRP